MSTIWSSIEMKDRSTSENLTSRRGKSAPLSRAQKRSARNRKKLMDAAMSVFSEDGVDASTIDNITERADLGKGTFYSYFSDKLDITTRLIEKSIDHLITKLRDVESPPNSIEEILEHILNVHYQYFMENNEGFVLLFQGRLLLKLEREIPEELEMPFLHYLEEIESLLTPFMREKVDLIKIRRLACAVAGFVFGFFSFAMIGMDQEEIEAGIKPLRQSFVRSLSMFLVK